MNPTHQSAVDVPVTPAVILRGAARYLQLHGWHRGTLYADTYLDEVEAATPAACAIGSIAMAAFGRKLPNDADQRPEWSDYQHASNALDDYLNLTCAKARCLPLGEWNDEDGRTAVEVIAALNAAADDWERLHTPPVGDRS